jgi:hypothetical protein
VSWADAFLEALSGANLPDPVPQRVLGLTVTAGGLLLAALAASSSSSLAGRNTFWQRLGVYVLGILSALSGFDWVAVLLVPAALWLLVASSVRTWQDRRVV